LYKYITFVAFNNHNVIRISFHWNITPVELLNIPSETIYSETHVKLIFKYITPS